MDAPLVGKHDFERRAACGSGTVVCPASRCSPSSAAGPYPVTLCCHVRTARPGREGGKLFCVRVAPDEDDLEALRADRLRKALSDKCPKLARCKDEGARTVLVLESDDIALTNQLLVRMALVDLLDERPDVPDEIYLVETETRSWAVYPMKVGAGVQFDDGLVSFTEFDEADLSALSSDS